MDKGDRVDSPLFHGVDDMLDRQHADITGRLESPLPIASGIRNGEDAALGQIEEDIIDKADRDFKLVRYLPGSQGSFSSGEVLDDILATADEAWTHPAPISGPT